MGDWLVFHAYSVAASNPAFHNLVNKHGMVRTFTGSMVRKIT